MSTGPDAVSAPVTAGRPGAPPRRLVAALVGNPNTGKTTLFNALSGLRQRTGNYPGVTVETKKGSTTCGGRPVDLIDLPGTYSLAPRSPDEMVAVDVILGRQAGEERPDVVVSIVDASNLDRNLYLTTQVLELGVPVVLALNMVDVAESQGLRVDAALLGQRLGVAVVPIQANKGKGLDALRQAVADAARKSAAGADNGQHRPAFPEPFEKETRLLLAELGPEVPAFLARRLLLDAGGYTEQRLLPRLGDGGLARLKEARERLGAAGCAVPAVEARTRYGWIRQATAGVVQRPAQRVVTWTDRIDRVLTHRFWGTLIFLLVMFVVFQAIFTAADYPMKWIGSGQEWLSDGLRSRLPAGAFTSLLLDGILTGVGSVLVFLPQIVILFGFIAVLEDCGYMARAAFLMDRLMSRCGLSGKSFIPLLSSVACAVPGIMATRVIENRRDRLATILVAPLMSCSARLPVYILLIGAFLSPAAGYPRWLPGLVMFSMYLIGLIAAPLMALLLKRTLLRGETPLFVMEMPLYKWPGLRTVLGRMVEATSQFLKRAGTLILASMVVVWALMYFPRGESGEARAAFARRLQADCEETREEVGKAAGDDRAAKEKELAGKEALRQRVEAGDLTYDVHYDYLRKEADDAQDEAKEALQARDRGEELSSEQLARIRKAEDAEAEANRLYGTWKRGSVLGQTGKWIEPVVRPLGWDWRVGMAALASFPAREVVVGTLGVIYNVGKADSDEIRKSDRVAETPLGQALSSATWDDDPSRKVFTVPAALSLMVFFALCCQCASTLAVIRRETRSWRWPAFTFAYMTALAYVGALLTYQIGTWIGG